MHTAAATELSPGDRRLLHDIGVVRCMIRGRRRPAAERVEELLGARLAHAVRASLGESRARAA